MLGARASGYGDVPGNFDAQHLAHIKRIRRPVDFVHAFASAKQLPFADRHVGVWARSRRDSYVIHNWKPVVRWRDAQDASARERIRVAARRIAHLKRPVMLVIHHEPENDLGERGVRKMSSGTPEEYRQMWRIVREAFDEAGAANVVWGMAYMNYPKWDEVVPELWPGDDLVDWLWFNAYGSERRPYIDENIAHFTAVADGAGIGRGKRWGIIEWGVSGTSREEAVEYFTGAKAFLDTPEADRLSAWVVFDSPGAHNEPGLRLAFDDQGRPHPEKLDAYKSFIGHSKFACHHVDCGGLPNNSSEFLNLGSGLQPSGLDVVGNVLPQRAVSCTCWRPAYMLLAVWVLSKCLPM